MQLYIAIAIAIFSHEGSQCGKRHTAQGTVINSTCMVRGCVREQFDLSGPLRFRLAWPLSRVRVRVRAGANKSRGAARLKRLRVGVKSYG